MISAFISSTKPDLIEYRHAAMDICSRLGFHFLAMEYFEAEGSDGIAGSKRQLEQATVYIGIFAHRYGAVTEIEYDYAGERSLERLCFIVDPDYSWPIGHVDFKNRERLTTFLSKVGTENIRGKFTTIDDFKVKLMQALIKWMERAKIVPPSHPPHEAPIYREIPIRPDLVVGRENDIDILKQRLSSRNLEEPLHMTIIRGWPGVGKTTLINTLVHDEGIKAAFKDGILWAMLGETGDPLVALKSWGKQLGIYGIDQIESLPAIMLRIQAALDEKHSLLVIDDIWDISTAIPFKQVCGKHCHLLGTTRFPEIAQMLAIVPDRDIYLLDVLTDQQAFTLFSQLAPSVATRYSVETQQLVRDIEGLPLAIRVAGRLLDEEYRLGIDILGLIIDIQENRRLLDAQAPTDRFDPKTGTTPTINFLLQRSTDRLDPQLQGYYALLGAFAPKPATFDVLAMAYMWEINDEKAVLHIIRKLVNRGLLEPIPTINRFQMHAVLAMHAVSLLDHADI